MNKRPYQSYEESVNAAKAANAREREEVCRATGLRILADGRVLLPTRKES